MEINYISTAYLLVGMLGYCWCFRNPATVTTFWIYEPLINNENFYYQPLLVSLRDFFHHQHRMLTNLCQGGGIFFKDTKVLGNQFLDIFMLGVAPSHDAIGQLRFIGIPYWKCNNLGGDCYCEGGQTQDIFIGVGSCLNTGKPVNFVRVNRVPLIKN